MTDSSRRLETLSVGDVQIVTCVQGNGPTLVMLPSYGRDGLTDFDQVAARIAGGGWRVLRPQPRGIAGSIGPMRGLTLIDFADDIASVLRHFGGGPAVVLGHAFGNIVARVLAVEHLDLVRGIILAAASARPQEIASEVSNAPFVAGDLNKSPEERLHVLRHAFFASGHDARSWLGGWFPDTLAAQHEAVGATDLKRYWSPDTVPLLEIIGRSDPFRPPNLWSQMRDELGDRVTIVVIDDASHALFPEQPARVAETVSEWINRL